MGTFPNDFPVPEDQGGPGAGRPIGGFGGNPAADQAGHRATVQRIGKAPVLLVHGNGGAADTGDWDMLDLNRMLLAAGYSPELIWAPSYLGPGRAGRPADPAHQQRRRGPRLPRHRVHLPGRRRGRRDRPLAGLLADLRRLPRPGRRAPPPDQLGPAEEVAAAGHLRRTGRRLPRPGQRRARRVADRRRVHERAARPRPWAAVARTPSARANRRPRRRPRTTSPTSAAWPAATSSTRQKPGTGMLAGAVNKNYNLGSGLDGHEKIKESQVVFDDFLPLLNRVPPAPPVKLTVDQDSGALPQPVDRDRWPWSRPTSASTSWPAGSPRSSSTGPSSTRSWRAGRRPSPTARPSPWPPRACGS